MSNPNAWLLSDLPAVQRNGIKVMSTFACGGGSSMGYKRAGCTIIAANDIDPEMAWHYQKNLAPKHYFLCPIRDLLSADLPPELFELDILDGSPPCSTFSMAGSREKDWGKDKHFREGQAKQVLSDLFFDYLDLVGRLRPKVAIAENVKGMVLGNAKGYTKLIMARFRELGYRPQLFLVNSADCGVPQRRERVFFCAVREDIAAPPLRLAPTHQWVNCGEACQDLTITPDELREVAFTSNTDLTWWPKTHEAEGYDDAVKRAGQPVKLWNHKKLAANAPSLTLTATHKMIKHWKEPRCLTFREYARLGSFPDDYQVKTSDLGKYIIGMSVPPKMTEAVARAVIDQWLKPQGLDA